MDLAADVYVAAVATEGTRLAEVAGADLTAPVPSCGDWTQRDLVAHLAQVYDFVVTQLGAATDTMTRNERLEVPATDAGPEALIAWFGGYHERLLTALRDTAPTATAWTWTDRTDAGFYHRRMAHETTLHRWDAEAAVGPTTPIDAELAADGIDEVLANGLQYRLRGDAVTHPAGSLHLHRTDDDLRGPHEWMVVPDGAGRLTITHEHAKGDVAVRGAAEALLLWLWGRGNPDDLEIFGDQDLAAAWASVAP